MNLPKKSNLKKKVIFWAEFLLKSIGRINFELFSMFHAEEDGEDEK